MPNLCRCIRELYLLLQVASLSYFCVFSWFISSKYSEITQEANDSGGRYGYRLTSANFMQHFILSRVTILWLRQEITLPPPQSPEVF
jgi:hypothetical protein